MTLPPVLPVLQAWEPAAPRLTWYGDDGERVELSGRVLANWTVKAANLLAAECGAGPGTTVLLDLPAHWRLLVWALGGWAVGAELTAPDGDPDVVVATDPERWSGSGAHVVAVALPALARAWSGPLPAGTVDGASELMGQPDVPVFAVAPVRAAAPGAEPTRVLLLADDPATLLELAWPVWESGGSIVLVTPRGDDELAAIRAQERVDPVDAPGTR